VKYVIIVLVALLGVQGYFLYSSYAERTLLEYHYAQMGLTQSVHNVFFMREEKENPTYLESMLLCNIVGNFSQYEATYEKTREYIWLHKHEVDDEFNRELEKASRSLGKNIKTDYQYFSDFCYGNRSNW